ncbi:MAG: prephenate dehydrogenase [Acidimicrobiales bacterium]
MADVGVVGLGLIGGSVHRALGDRAVGWDPDPAVRAAAAADGLTVADHRGDVLSTPLVVVAAPLAVSHDVVAEVLAVVGDATVTDVASVKGPTLAAAADNPAFVPSHPMAGTERSGWWASDADLFRGAPWLVLTSDGADEARVGDVEQLAAAVGAKPMRLDPTVHDKILARISHLPHVLAAVLTLLAEPHLPLAAGSMHGAARVAAGDPALPTAMVDLNHDEVTAAIDELIGQLQRFRDDRDAAAWFARARAAWSRH